METHLMISDPDFSWTSLSTLALRHSSCIGKATTICTAQCSVLRRLEDAPEWQLTQLLLPACPVLEKILPDLDQMRVMTVNPGFGHRHFLRSTLPKIRRSRK